MNIPKAIEILQTIHADIDIGHEDDDLDAIRLGIEAMKRVQDIRNDARFPGMIRLPGETKE